MLHGHVIVELDKGLPHEPPRLGGPIAVFVETFVDGAVGHGRLRHNGTMSDLETLPVTEEIVDTRLDEPQLEDGDHERFAHYVKKDKIVSSAVEGTPVRALCGKKWVPNRDPKKFPVCPECKEIYEMLRGE